MYLIADTNGINAEAKLSVGQILRIPPRINTVYNDASTFRPFNPADLIGNTAPAMPAPGKRGCGGVGQFISIVIAVAVTYMTGFAALGNAASQLFNMSTGAQKGFNWKAVIAADIGQGISAGVDYLANANQLGSTLGNTDTWAKVGRVVLSCPPCMLWTGSSLNSWSSA